MKLSPEDTLAYPKFTQYLKHAIPIIQNNALICYNLKKCGLTKAQIPLFLNWSTGPTVKIHNLSNSSQPGFNVCAAGVASAYGCTRSTNLNQIEIDSISVAEFEKNPYGIGCGKNSRHQNVFIVGVTLLHELCHLACFINNISEATLGGEAGFAFEKGTYGKAVP